MQRFLTFADKMKTLIEEYIAEPKADVELPTADQRPQHSIALKTIPKSRNSYRWSVARKQAGKKVAKITGAYYGVTYAFVLPDNDIEASVLLAKAHTICEAKKSAVVIIRAGVKRAREEAHEEIAQRNRILYRQTVQAVKADIIASRPNISLDNVAVYCDVQEKISF